jgi:hypothetical protein
MTTRHIQALSFTFFTDQYNHMRKNEVGWILGLDYSNKEAEVPWVKLLEYASQGGTWSDELYRDGSDV